MPPARLIENAHVAVKRWRHGLLMYNINDSFIGRSIDLYGEWCESELSLLGQFLQPGDFAVDVGANIGTHTVFLAQTVGPKGVVIAFEPQRLAFQFLCGNTAINALTNVHCSNAAVGAESGSIVVPMLDPTKEMNIGALGLGKHKQGETVNVITIDQFQLSRCKLIKIDVEGAEVAVLQGARQTIERLRPALFVENNTVENSGKVIKTIQDMGYKCWWHIAPYFDENNFFQNKENIFSRFQPEANLLCFPQNDAPEINGLMPVEGIDDNWQKAFARMRSAG